MNLPNFSTFILFQHKLYEAYLRFFYSLINFYYLPKWTTNEASFFRYLAFLNILRELWLIKLRIIVSTVRFV